MSPQEERGEPFREEKEKEEKKRRRRSGEQRGSEGERERIGERSWRSTDIIQRVCP